MRRFIAVAVIATFVCMGIEARKRTGQSSSPADSLRAEIAATPQKAGGVYYAYPYTSDSMAPAPVGYEPFYNSHYGRHGSRWLISRSSYDEALTELRKQDYGNNLTDAGKDILHKIEFLARHSEGHEGELSPVGERQHKRIAARMFRRFPELFKDSAKIVARASTEPRCIMSMLAFSEELMKLNPKLYVERHASPADIKYIRNHTEETRALEKEDAPWRIRFATARDSLSDAQTTAAKIFNSPSEVTDIPSLMRAIFEVALDVQDLEGVAEYNYIDIFHPDDLYNIWKVMNYQIYVRNANSPDGTGAGPRSAANQLNEIIERADNAITGKSSHTVDLRFGHDSALQRLLALMDVEGCNAVVSGFENVAENYQGFRITPMAANFQLTLLRNADGDVIAAPRLNERPVKIAGVKEIAGYPGYYKWEELREKWKSGVRD